MMRTLIKTIQVKNGYIQIDLSNTEIFNDWATSIQKAGYRALAEKNDNDMIDTSEFCKELADKFNTVFGKGACLKTFGVVVPNFKQYEEFVINFTGLVNQWVK